MELGPSPLSAAEQDPLKKKARLQACEALKNIGYDTDKDDTLKKHLPRLASVLASHQAAHVMARDEARAEAQAEARVEAQAAQAEHGVVYEQMANKSTWLEQPGSRVGHSESDDEGELGQAPKSTTLNYEQQKEQDRLWRRLKMESKRSTAMSHFGRDDPRNAEKIESGKSECAVEAEKTAEASNDEMSYNPNTGHGPEDEDEEEEEEEEETEDTEDGPLPHDGDEVMWAGIHDR